MTLPLRKNRRTIAPRTRRCRTGCRLAALLLLLAAAPALGQQPYRPAAPAAGAAAFPIPKTEPPKKDFTPPPEVTQLPPRDLIFMMRDDAALELVIRRLM